MLKPKKRLVKAQIKEDKLLKFTARAQKVVDKYWKHAAIVLAAVVVIILAFNFVLAARESKNSEAALQELKVRDAYSRGDFDETLRLINTILDDYPGTPSVPAALMLMGRIYQQRGEYDQAVEIFEKIIRKYSGNSYLAFGAYVGIGAIEFGRAEYEKAADNYKAAASKYPDHFNAPDAFVRSGESYQKINRYEDAKHVYRLVLKQYPKSRSANTAREKLAELEFADLDLKLPE